MNIMFSVFVPYQSLSCDLVFMITHWLKSVSQPARLFVVFLFELCAPVSLVFNFVCFYWLIATVVMFDLLFATLA